MTKEVFLAAAVRAPIGRFGGALAGMTAADMGVVVALGMAAVVWFLIGRTALGDGREVACDLLDVGDDRAGAVCRELTKTQEEGRCGPLGDLASWAAEGGRGEERGQRIGEDGGVRSRGRVRSRSLGLLAAPALPAQAEARLRSQPEAVQPAPIAAVADGAHQPAGRNDPADSRYRLTGNRCTCRAPD